MIEIRRFRKEDARLVSKAICRSLIEVNSRDYEKHEIEEYVKGFTPETIKKMDERLDVFVAEVDKEVVGTASLGVFEEGEKRSWTVFTVFVDPDYHGKGVGKKLMEGIEELAISRGVEELIVPSGLTAYGFYTGLGYEEIEFIKAKKIHLMKKRIKKESL